MDFRTSSYIEQRYGGLFVKGHRVSLDSIVVHHKDGASPQRIAESFPTLQLFEVYGAIAYYLEHQDAVDEYMREGERRLREQVPHLSQQNPELYARLEAARKHLPSERA